MRPISGQGRRRGRQGKRFLLTAAVMAIAAAIGANAPTSDIGTTLKALAIAALLLVPSLYGGLELSRYASRLGLRVLLFAGGFIGTAAVWMLPLWFLLRDIDS